MAARARLEMEENWDSVQVTARLYASYRALLAEKLLSRKPDAAAGPIPISF